MKPRAHQARLHCLYANLFGIPHFSSHTGGPTTFNGCASVLKTKPFVLPLPATWKTLSWYHKISPVFLPSSLGRKKTHRRVYQIRILQYLGEQEALLHVEERSPFRGVDVRDGRETLTGSRRCVYGEKGVPCPVLVHCVALVCMSARRSRAQYSDEDVSDLPVIL